MELMAWDPARDGERRQSYCPICKDRRAKAVQITEGAKKKIIELECESCGFSWEVEHSIPTTDA